MPNAAWPCFVFSVFAFQGQRDARKLLLLEVVAEDVVLISITAAEQDRGAVPEEHRLVVVGVASGQILEVENAQYTRADLDPGEENIRGGSRGARIGRASAQNDAGDE